MSRYKRGSDYSEESSVYWNKKRRRDESEDSRKRSSPRRRSRSETSRSSSSGSYSGSSQSSRSRSSSSSSKVRGRTSRFDDKDGHYIYYLGESITARYKVLSLMGEGTFGKVVECWDRERKEYVAIKIVKNIEKYRDAAMIEIDVLNTLKKADPENKHNCVRLDKWFDYRGHVCMVFEKLGLSLYDFLRKNSYRPFSMKICQSFAKQILQSLAFIHSLDLIHTDLKPENILLQSPGHVTEPSSSSSHPYRIPADTRIKLIDFGSATFENQYHTSVVSTRHYRAPEVILGQGWTFPCDVWSVGCIFVELYTGDALFQTHENLEHLAMMERVVGKFPLSMTRTGHHCRKYFHRDGTLRWPEGATTSSVRHVRRMHRLKNIIAKEHDLFLDLVSRLLEYDASTRISAKEALKHPFFYSVYDD